jgi:NADH-quinone oxidoreductase subunit N
MDLITLFVGLETMSVPLYVLAGFLRRQPRSPEAALKYLLLGAFSTGFLAYGFSLLYGLTGTLKLAEMAGALAAVPPNSPMLLLALVTVAAGLLFKVGAAPFHMWIPDAYEGAPTPITAFLSVASKAAAFALLVRLLLGPLAPLRDTWQPIAAGAAVLSLTIGNLAALTQTSVKRMLAYSSISHAGYILLGVLAGNDLGYRAALLYTAIYAAMNLGAFLILAVLRRGESPGEHLEDLRGLAARHPWHALLMLLFLLSLAGIPPTGGFIAKYFIFAALIEARKYALAVAGALYVAVSLYYYFRIAREMYAGTEQPPAPLALSAGTRLALVSTAILTIGSGVFPEPLIRWVRSLQ